MSLTPADLRGRIAAGIVVGMPSWRESPLAFDFFPGVIGDDQVAEAQQFAVGLGRSVPQRGRQRRTGAGAGVLMLTDVRVRFTDRLRADGQVEDTDAALDNEVRMVDAVLAVDRDPDLSVQLTGIELRTVAPPGLYLGEVRFSVLHLYPLGVTGT